MRRRLIIGAILILGLTAVVVYNYIYKDHRDIQSEQAAFTGSAAALNQSFKDGSQKLLNNTVVVTGTVEAVEPNGITLTGGVYCSFNQRISGIKIGQDLTVKGRSIGYDELFEVVTMDQCNIIN